MTERTYTRLNEYIEKNGTLEQVWVNKVTGERCTVDADEFMVLYSPILDGNTLDEETAMRKYPEWFI